MSRHKLGRRERKRRHLQRQRSRHRNSIRAVKAFMLAILRRPAVCADYIELHAPVARYDVTFRDPPLPLEQREAMRNWMDKVYKDSQERGT